MTINIYKHIRDILKESIIDGLEFNTMIFKGII